MKYLKERFRALADIYEANRKARVPQLLLSFLAVVTIAGILVYHMEEKAANSLFHSIGDGIWWGFVTIATVGYGDKYPVTVAGRIIGILVMASGMILTVILSGTIASILVERKMKEGKGLQKIQTTGHTIICGWNPGGPKILQGFQQVGEKLKKKHSIVLVNEMEIDALNEVQFTYNSKFLELEFIRGNFTHEQVLDNANIRKAEAVIILADTSGGNTAINADERTVLASFTISNLNPGARISAELINPQNEQHLKRTNVESIVISGEFNGFMLANSALFPGVPQALKEIMSFNLKNEITTRSIPSPMVGKKFEDLFRYMKDRENSLLIGVISETKKLSIDDFLSEDPSSIDEFIKRKFAESEKDLFADTGGKISIVVNPGWDYVINEFDKALVIGEVKGKQ